MEVDPQRSNIFLVDLDQKKFCYLWSKCIRNQTAGLIWTCTPHVIKTVFCRTKKCEVRIFREKIGSGVSGACRLFRSFIVVYFVSKIPWHPQNHPRRPRDGRTNIRLGQINISVYVMRSWFSNGPGSESRFMTLRIPKCLPQFTDKIKKKTSKRDRQ